MWRGRLGMNVTFSALCGCPKLISWTSLFKLGRTKSTNYNYNLVSYRLGSSLSSNNYYDHFFPSFYDGYVSHRIEWYYSFDPPQPPSHEQVDQALQNVFDKDRMDFPRLQNEYDFDWTKVIFTREGDYCDVISLLSTHGDQLVRIGAIDNNNNKKTVKAENLRGKHILICCAAIPLLWMDRNARHLRNLSLLGSEMSQTHIGLDFEIVIVANMRSLEWDDEGVFDHFLTAFSGCLAVPFHHKYRREYICRSLSFEQNPKSILVDPSQKVMQFSCLEEFVEFGARGFPFTTDHLASLSNQDEWGDPCCPDPPPPCNRTLAGLLSCESDPTSFLLRKLNSEETISVEQLNKHHVALYLFNQGDLLKRIHGIYQLCKDEGLDFEIVLVLLPCGYSTHPKDFHQVVHNVLNKFQISNWWIIPYNNSVCLRLYNLCDGDPYYFPLKDHMIIVGPHNNFVDRIDSYDIYHHKLQFDTQAYPFTREGNSQAFLRRIMNITLESFLTCKHVYKDYECDDTEIMHVMELKNKNVVVYMDNPLCLGPPWTRYGQVVQLYNKIKKVDSDFEVVFVPSLFPVPEAEFPKLYSKARECIFESEMKWRVCPFNDPRHLELLQNNDAVKLMDDSCLPFSVLAFGKDGHIHSLDVLQLFRNHGIGAYPFLPGDSRNQTLHDEISR